MNDIKEKVRAYLLQSINQGKAFTDADDIFELGIVNSLFAMQLITFMETKFSIRVENDDLEISNFNTVNNITGFIQRKLNVITTA
ncbi:acyl carrier protein [Chitinophaga japonensis]|uniref:Acyl carrier protein n=1 Tax=Chitinophaga japonensis TaxID=104662 RepID=A0A562SN84_CHIJA|nr:acyl carrier protein [Chitinophaga japonensis]TWI82126.1 acyl carrier protein [Chitinophaga japonensis]